MNTSSSTTTPRIKISIPRSISSSLQDSSTLSDDDAEEQEFVDDCDDFRTSAAVEDDPVDKIPTGSEGIAMTPRAPSHHATTSTSSLWEGLRNKTLNFPINTECTSLCLSPSGHFVWAGFSDGTLRVFDLCGKFDFGQETWQSHRQKSTLMVPSTSHQRFGAVACQIHARGVHTDLLMQVTTCGEYVFGGVPRGAIEVYAVHIKELEDQATAMTTTTMKRYGMTSSPDPHGPTESTNKIKNILDYIDVNVHADAKLKGLGACAQLKTTARPTYLLLTGKGIKNIHIWKFQPPHKTTKDSVMSEPVWEQLYDTQTNGNTINFLSFYRNPEGILWGVSQSDTQKVRLWDLSLEEKDDPDTNRPKRPDYDDVTNSQAALGIAGAYGVCGGPTMYNQFSIVSLDNPKSMYNHMELALPGEASWGRQRRGDLKQVVNVATMTNDSNNALLELNDGSIVHYTSNESGEPKLEILTEQKTGIRPLPADYWCRTLCLGNPGLVLAALAYYNPNTQLGHIEVRSLEPVPMSSPIVDSKALSRLCMEGPPPSTSKMEKKKKKRKKQIQQCPDPERGAGPFVVFETPMRRGSGITNNKVPISMDSSDQAIVKEKKKKKSKEITTSSAFSIPASDQKSHAEEVSAPSLQTPSHSNNSMSMDTNSQSPTAVILPQVSPHGTTTPAIAPNTDGAPLSEQSSSADHGTITKFLKPKRVLHDYSEEQTPKRLDSIPPTKVPKPEVSAKPKDSDRPHWLQSSKGDGECLELKVRTTLKVHSRVKASTQRQGGIPSEKTTEQSTAKTWKDESSASTGTNDSGRSISLQSSKGDGECLELKVRTAPKVQSREKASAQRKGEIPSEKTSELSAVKVRKDEKDESLASARTNDSDRSIPLPNRQGDGQCLEVKAPTTPRAQSLELKAPTTPRVQSGVAVSTHRKGDSPADTMSESVAVKVRKDQKDESPASLSDSSQDLSLKSNEGKVESLELKVRTTVKVNSATAGTKRKGDKPCEKEPKRPCQEVKSVANSMHNAAHMLVDMKSPTPKANDPPHDFETGVKVTEFLQKLLNYSRTLPNPKSRLLTQKIDAFGSFPSQSRLDQTLIEHRTAQIRIQKQLLQAAESTLRLLAIKRMTLEGIRSELKDIIRSFEEIVHDTLTRQKLELESLIVDGSRIVPPLTMAYQGAFDVVRDIYNSIETGKRGPGRPKNL